MFFISLSYSDYFDSIRQVDEVTFTSAVSGEKHITIFWNLLKIPEDLSCFQPCKAEFERQVIIEDLKEIPAVKDCKLWEFATYEGKPISVNHIPKISSNL